MKVICCLCCLLGAHMAVAQTLTPAQLGNFSKLPLKCVEHEFPNKLNQSIISADELQKPSELHPIFYGCFDWHSAVHGYWSLVYLLNHHPDVVEAARIKALLIKNITPENMAKEIAYFEKPHEKSWERLYGWAWFLKLQQTLDEAPDAEVRKLGTYTLPLTNLLIQRYAAFLPKQLYPQRVGTHNNTAFGLSFAYDYAASVHDEAFLDTIRRYALRYYGQDRGCPIAWEPSGTDFLSPCFEELGLMVRVLDEKAFLKWCKKFMPALFKANFSLEVAKVGDRTDGHLVHLDGLNFSRAWNLMELANRYPKHFQHLRKVAQTHANFSLPAIVDGNYEGEHWLASFALHMHEVGLQQK